ncbi:MAG: LLM class F420-dependent oxidoreductase [Nakamurella sp.]
MRIGLNLSYVTTAEELADNLALAQAAESLGFDMVWAAEAYGSDAVTVLAAVAARTHRIGIGSAVLQIPGRTPAMTAMTAATLDALSGGRFSLGLGVSGPQVSEGWHGVRFGDPIGRTTEYVQIVRQALRRRRVTAGGSHFTLPLPDGPGKSLVLALQPVRSEIPIYLAALGPKNLELTGQIADGWLGIFFDPDTAGDSITRIANAATAAGRDPASIDICVSVPVSIGDDPRVAANRLRGNAALYIGGMGSAKTNFYHRTATEMGYGTEADEVQERFLARDYRGAAAAVPDEFIDRTSLLGNANRIGERLQRLADGGVSSISVLCFDADLEAKIATLTTVMQAAQAIGVTG